MQERLLQSFTARTLLRTSSWGLARGLARAWNHASAWVLASCHAGIFPVESVGQAARIQGMDLLRHELRTPVAGILGMCELLQKSDLSGEQFELASAVEESGKQLLRIIARFGEDQRDVIDISQREKSVVNGAVMMEQIIRAHWPAAHRKGIGLFLLYDHRLPARWQTDIACLRQLLDNLLSNAIKFTSAGHVLVEAQPSEFDSGGRADVELAVSDTGIGIAQRDARRIYSLRTQGSGGIAERFGGSGLGLHVCSRVVSMLGGCITHESPEPGKTCFRVKLPDLVEPGAERFDRLQPGLLREMNCLLVMKPPRVAVLKHLLLRIGVQLRVNADPWNSEIPVGVDVVICDEELLPGSVNEAHGASAQNGILLLTRPFVHNPEAKDTLQGVVVTELPQPVLRSNLEPVLLRMALHRKLAGANRMA